MQAILPSLEEEKSWLPLRWRMWDGFPRVEEVSDLTTPTVKAFLWRDVVSLPNRLEVSCRSELSSGRWGRSEAGVLRQPLHEWSTNQIPTTRKIGACSLHHLEEAQALLPNLFDYSPHLAPLRRVEENLKAAERISKWALKLRSYGLRCEPRAVIKGQVLADFIADFTPGATKHVDLLEGWILNADRASNSRW